MQALLEDLNSLPGVVGSAFCDAHRGILARSFPPDFDDATLEAVAAALAAASPGLHAVAGPVGVIDLRFREGRVVVRPVGDGALLVLCDKTANAQEVLAFASVACKKFERLRSPGAVTGQHPAQAVPQPTPARPQQAAAQVVQPPARGATPPATAALVAQGPDLLARYGRPPLHRRLLRGLIGLLAVAALGAGIYFGWQALRGSGEQQPKPAAPALPAAEPLASAPAPAPAAPAAPAAGPAEVRLRLAGADALSSQLLPELVGAYLRSQQAPDVLVDRSRSDAVRVQGTLDGTPVGVQVALGGTAKGLADLLAGNADIAVATRRVRAEERQKLAVLGPMTSSANEHVVALAGVAIIVNKANGVQSLNREQLTRLLGGAASDWSQFGLEGEDEWSAVGVGGKGGPVSSGVHVYLPDERSGLSDLIQGALLGAKPFAAEAKRLASVQAVADAVAGDPGGIGVVPMQAVNGARPVPVADLDDPPLLPTPFTVATEDYLLTQRLYLYTAQASQNPQVARFVEFALSAAGQAEVRKAGFVELGVKAENRAAPAGAPPEFVRLTAGARRLSTTFRFEVGSAGFDSRAQRDLDRVVEYLRLNDLGGSDVRLLGFADTSGSKASNQQLSLERATQLAQALAQRGITGVRVAGMGSALPVADNASDEGRRRNRRVEVWLAGR
jgi:phosphate transport system substrate-binding protein